MNSQERIVSYLIGKLSLKDKLLFEHSIETYRRELELFEDLKAIKTGVEAVAFLEEIIHKPKLKKKSK
jgi:hypothetical protein